MILNFLFEDIDHPAEKSFFEITEKPELTEKETIHKQYEVIKWYCDKEKKEDSYPPAPFFRNTNHFKDDLFNIKHRKTCAGKNYQDDKNLEG